MKCRVCTRQASHWNWFGGHLLKTLIAVPTCSRACMEIYLKIGPMDGLSPQERAAIEAAAEAGGKYLDSIRKTDLAKLTETQWLTFIEAAVVTALDKLAELSLESIPFPEVKAKP